MRSIVAHVFSLTLMLGGYASAASLTPDGFSAPQRADWGCFVVGQYDDGFWIGLGQRIDNSQFVLMGHMKWAALQEGKEYNNILSFSQHGQRTIRGKASTTNGILYESIDSWIMEAFAKQPIFYIEFGGMFAGPYNLRGSAAALEEVRECVSEQAAKVVISKDISEAMTPKASADSSLYAIPEVCEWARQGESLDAFPQHYYSTNGNGQFDDGRWWIKGNRIVGHEYDCEIRAIEDGKANVHCDMGDFGVWDESLPWSKSATAITIGGGGASPERFERCDLSVGGNSRADDWSRYDNPRFGYRIDIPPGFSAVSEAANSDGGISRSDDGRAELRVWGSYLTQGNFKDEIRWHINQDVSSGSWKITYQKQDAAWASWSGTKGSRILYQRAIPVCDGAVAYFRFEYDSGAKEAFDPVIGRLVKSLQSRPCGSNSDSVVSKSAEYPRLPITEYWFEIEGNNLEGYLSARRYSLVIDTPDNMIRNTIIFQCTTSDKTPSFINFVIPKELQLKSLYGVNNIPERNFSIDVTTIDGLERVYQLTGEVKDNELFFDFLGNDRAAVIDLIEAKRIRINLIEGGFPIEFFRLEPGKTLPWEGKEMTLDEFVRTMMDREGRYSKAVSNELLFRTCIDIKKWKEH